MLKASDLYDSAIAWFNTEPDRAQRLAVEAVATAEYKSEEYAKASKIAGMSFLNTAATVVDPKEAIKYLHNAWTTDSDPSSLAHLSTAYGMDYNTEEAIKAAERCAWLFPDHEDAHIKLHNAYLYAGRYASARSVEREYVEKFNTDYAHMALGLNLLLLSDIGGKRDRKTYMEGIFHGQGRYPQLARVEGASMSPLPWSPPVEMEMLDRELVVVLEQGLGDCIMMIPYIQHMGRMVKHLYVISSDHDAAVDLYRSLGCFAGNVTTYKTTDERTLGGIQYVHMMDLLAIGMPHEIVGSVRIPSMGMDDAGGKVGICWRGNPKHPNDWWRSMRFSDIKPFIEKHGKKLVSLQSNLKPEERTFLESAGVEIASEIVDHNALIATLNGLDAVVTVDTFMSHMAGYLGVKCYTLLATNVDWRWGCGSDKSDWYPNHTLLRQKKCGDWSPLLNELNWII